MLSDQEQEESIVVLIDQKILSNMLNEAEKWLEVETGGMLFGSVQQSNLTTKIIISKTYIPPETATRKSSMYFEIDPDYARKVLKKEKLLYLGNWHKHLGYGGPSRADHQQVKEFFLQNPHKNLIIAVILDYRSTEDHNLIIEVYKRIESLFQENKGEFETYLISEDQIHFFTCGSSEESSSFLGITGIQIAMIKQNLVETFDPLFNEDQIHEFSGSSPGERIISFPYEFVINTKKGIKTVQLLVLISIPPEFPEGQIYIDLSSQDLSRNFTFDKQPANFLAEKELIQPFFDLLKTKLEDDALSFLLQPVWQIMSNPE
ncbi:MAG: Mov34/MPN/PAD-1 family protein [Candidatus Hodarchaeales archaeon]